MARRTPAEPEVAAQVQGRYRPRGGHPLLGLFVKIKADNEWNSCFLD